MAFPVNARYEVRVAGTTTVKAGWADASDDALNGIYGATRTALGLHLDSTGYTAKAAPGSPTIKAWGATLKLQSDANGVEVTAPDGLTNKQGYLIQQDGTFGIQSRSTGIAYGSAGQYTAYQTRGGASYTDPLVYEIVATAHSTDAATTHNVIVLAMTNNSALTVETQVVAVESTYSTMLFALKSTGFRRAGANAIESGAAGVPFNVHNVADEIGVTSLAWVASGGSIAFQVQGKAATTINWTVRAKVVITG